VKGYLPDFAAAAACPDVRKIWVQAEFAY